jgi:methionyl-tRNA formyltransferase
MEKLKIGYFADGPWSHQALNKILPDPNLKVKFVCARDDKPDLVLKELAEKNSIDFFTHPKINSDEFFNRVRAYDCNLFVSLSFNQIFRKRIIELPKLKTINCHAGKLPFYRGRNVLNWVLINDEKEFGITVHYIDETIDTGDILNQKVFPITDEDNYETLLNAAYAGCAELLYQTLKFFEEGGLTRKKQVEIHPLGFYCTARKKGDERLSWNQSSREVFNFVRAICRPGPEARTFFQDTEIKINRTKLVAEAPVFKGIPGAVLGVDSEGFFVKTQDSYVKVVDWSGPSSIKIGDRFK